jgi:CRP-like cAMP-binding protein
MESYWFLKHCQLFERLSSQELRGLETVSQFRRFPAGSPVYLPSDRAQTVLLLIAGRVKICHLTPDGKELILALIDPGELFGELALFDPGSRNELAETVEASTLVSLPGEALARLLEQHAELSLGITRLVGFRRRRIEQRLKNLLFQPHRVRLIHLLLELAERYGRSIPEGLLIDIRLSQQDLAAIIGSSRESVTLGLRELVAGGLLRRQGRRLIVVSVAALTEAMNGSSLKNELRRPTSDSSPPSKVKQHTAAIDPLDYNE